MVRGGTFLLASFHLIEWAAYWALPTRSSAINGGGYYKFKLPLTTKEHAVGKDYSINH